MCVPNVTLMLIDNKCRFFGVQLTTTQIVIYEKEKKEKTEQVKSEANANETRLLFKQHFNMSIKNIKLIFLIIQNENKETTRKNLSLSVSL